MGKNSTRKPSRRPPPADPLGGNAGMTICDLGEDGEVRENSPTRGTQTVLPRNTRLPINLASTRKTSSPEPVATTTSAVVGLAGEALEDASVSVGTDSDKDLPTDPAGQTVFSEDDPPRITMPPISGTASVARSAPSVPSGLSTVTPLAPTQKSASPQPGSTMGLAPFLNGAAKVRSFFEKIWQTAICLVIIVGLVVIVWSIVAVVQRF